MNNQLIINNLPYQKPFLFVDEILEIDENGVKGTYTYKENEFFYEGHFKDKPITPGVILTETMAQIGVVCLGIFLLKDEIGSTKKPQIALTSNHVDFYLPVLPNEKVTVISEKVYFRFNKLKCEVKMVNTKNELVCRGEISGMIIA
ncbi:3-hydroxyacyl-ACP dehydratase FabZ family protein [Polaribacter septentrionalilitoris]|uniref:3-hydroxyacyl-ACP dehydratase FabZ family protein n=1 Tax=Polaribacter septentrionalilitoris TaxID=2494657 RepID=UPI00135B234A|nr:hydroxymyristoyl-ACP dehydratase [Polaribacter septentrionalilitoris]